MESKTDTDFLPTGGKTANAVEFMERRKEEEKEGRRIPSHNLVRKHFDP